MHRPDDLQPTGHVMLPAAAIGGLSLLLAAGIELLGVTERINQAVRLLVARGGKETFTHALPEWVIWSGTAVVAFGIAFTILETPGMGRRWLFWLSAIMVVAAWAPVLSLAAYAPDVSAPCIAAIWSGICAMIYVTRHHMPVDQVANPPV